MKHTDISAILAQPQDYYQKQLTVCGWIRTTRDSKNVGFIELNDGTCLANLQVVVDKQQLNVDVATYTIGSAIKVVGKAMPSQGNNAVDFVPDEIVLLGECPADYPLQKKRHTMEFLRTIPHLRVRTRSF